MVTLTVAKLNLAELGVPIVKIVARDGVWSTALIFGKPS